MYVCSIENNISCIYGVVQCTTYIGTLLSSFTVAEYQYRLFRDLINVYLRTSIFRIFIVYVQVVDAYDGYPLSNISLSK